MKRLAFVVMLGIVFSLLGGCGPQDSGVLIEDAWARPALTGENTAIYFRATSYEEGDALVSAHASFATKTELHRSMMADDGAMKMERQEQINLPLGETVVLEPGGLHVMLIGLTRDLTPGDQVSLQLTFAGEGMIEIDVPVKTP